MFRVWAEFVQLFILGLRLFLLVFNLRNSVLISIRHRTLLKIPRFRNLDNRQSDTEEDEDELLEEPTITLTRYSLTISSCTMVPFR